MIKTRITKVLNAVTSTTTSNLFNISDAVKVGLLFRRAAHTSGSSTFTVSLGFEPGVSALTDDTATPTMTACSMLIDNITNTNAQNYTRIASKALSSNTDAIVWLDPAVVAQWITVTGTVATDGNATCYLIEQVQV